MGGEKTMIPHIKKGIVNINKKPGRWKKLPGLFFFAALLASLLLCTEANAQGPWGVWVSSSPGGTTNPAGGTFRSVDDGETFGVEILSLDPGYDFVEWKINHLEPEYPYNISYTTTSTSNPLTIIVKENLDITPTFAHIEYTLSTSVAGAFGAGTVTKSPDQATYHYGDVVQLSAVPGTGEEFANWSGDLAGAANPETITIDGNKAVTATFDFIEYTLDVSSMGGTGGATDRVTKNPAKATYHYGEVVELTANPQAGETFGSWGGDLTGSTNPETITIDGNKTVTATFNFIEYTLDVSSMGGTGGATDRVTKNPAKATYHYGEVVELTANPQAGETFGSWGGDLTGSTNPETITIDGNKTVTATFNFIEYTLDVSSMGGTGGATDRVTKNPAKATYHYGEMVQLTANPQAGETFGSWGGDLAGSTNPETITIDGNKTVTATFNFIEYTLDVSSMGGTGGATDRVTRNPAKGTYHYGEVVELTANPQAGETFGSWGGDLTGSTNPETITIDGNKTVTATFNFIEYTLEINMMGTGSGTVTKLPDKATYHYGDIVSLSALSSGDSVFIGFDGALNGATPINVIIDSDKVVSALFQLKRTLVINNPGSGTGTVDVAVSPSGLSAGAAQNVPAGGSLSLTIADGDTVDITGPNAAGGSVFILDGSDVPVTGLGISGEPAARTAVFQLGRILAINNPGSGNGTVDVAVSPSGLSAGAGQDVPAGGSLSLTIADGDTVDITNPNAAVGSIFVADGSDVPISGLTISGDPAERTAIFQAMRTVTISNPGSGTGNVNVSITPTNLESGPFTIPANGALILNTADGDNVSLTNRTADEGSVFIAAGSDLADPDNFAISGSNVDRTAIFQLTRTLMINNTGSGSGTVDVAMSPSGLSAGAGQGVPSGGSLSLTVADGDTVDITGPAGADGSVFITDISDVPVTSLEISGDPDERAAIFELRRTITVTNPGLGSGALTVDSCIPSGLDAGKTLDIGAGESVVFNVAQNDTVKLSALAAGADDYFEGFNGDMMGTTPIDILVNGDQSVKATFKKGLTLTIQWVGSGTGTVTASDGGILPLSPFVGGSSSGTEGTTAAYVCLEGDVIRLEAGDFFFPETATSGSKFKGWGGDGSGTDYTVDITMDANKTVTAYFNATYTLSISKGGTGEGRGEVAAGAGSGSSLSGGPAPGTYLYEAGDQVFLTATDIDPTAELTGCEFQNWTVGYGKPGEGFESGSKSTSVTISGDLSITGNFIGKYMITSLAKLGGSITPLGQTIKYHGESQPYDIAANMNYITSDIVVDGFSQGAMAQYTFNDLSANHTILAVFVLEIDYIDTVTAGDDQIYATSVPPLVMMVMGRNHKLYYEAYNDASDLDGDGKLDVGYNPAIQYYGYFDSYKVYKYDATNERFYPVRATQTKKVDPYANDEWSGDFLNYVTMSRIDVLRRVLYGGYRSVDTATETELMRSYIPQDAHSWGKEYESIERDGYDISDYTPLDLPKPNLRRVRHLFANTTLADPNSIKNNDPQPDLNRPLLRVLNDSKYRIWEWVSIERPVAGDKCVDGTIGPDCATASEEAGIHPGHPENALQFQYLLNDYAVESKKFGEGPADQINGSGNPFGSGYSPYDQDAEDQTNYLTIFRGNLVPSKAGKYVFAVDGGNAVEVLINGAVVAGKYGSSGRADDPKMPYSSKNIDLAAVNTVEFRHEVSTGGGSYTLYWKGSDSSNQWEVIPAAKFQDLKQSTYELITEGTPESTMQDFVVKVVVGDPALPEPNSKKYPSGVYKPTGLLQKFGEPGKMFFGLLTGTYEKNISGGVLRKRIGSVADEIDPNTGRFRYKYDGTYSNVNGDIIKTIDGFRIADYGYKYYAYGNPDTAAWATSRDVMAEGDSPDWGNPIAEMMYEGLRYFAGKKAPTGEFNYTSGSAYDVQLGLTQPSWDDPYESNLWCAKPFMLVISDVNPNFDSDQLPGAHNSENKVFKDANFKGTFSSSDTTPVALNVEEVANFISTEEGGLGYHYIGQRTTTFDSSCSPKDLSAYGFGQIRGLCPEEPTKQGSYYSAAAAYFGRIHDINPIEEEQNVITYTVAMASPLPRIEIPVGAKTITLVPFGNSVHGCLGVGPTGGYNPSITIVDFYLEALSDTNGIIRINFADIEHGAYHDLDAIVIYTYQLIDANGFSTEDPNSGDGVRISLQSEYSSSCLTMHVGYIISGTTADGTYLEVRSLGVSDDQDMDYFLDTPPEGYSYPGLPVSTTRVFYPGDTNAATLLNDPLWYAAKWGGFTDLNDNKVPDLESEWDQKGGEVPVPDTYFYVVNPLKLEQQLTRAFVDILSRGVSHVAPAVSVDERNRIQSGDRLYMAFFKPISDNYWQGNVKKYGLDLLERSDCGRDYPEWTVVDQDGLIAGECDGLFKITSRSFWSSDMDGGYVDRGGVGERLLASMPGSDPVLPPTVGPYWDFRNIYTYKGAADGSMVRFIHEKIDNNDLNVLNDYTRYRIINFMYGYTYDSMSSNEPEPKEKRPWILGDVIHSEPKLLDYVNASTGVMDHRYIVVGANDGMLHVFDDETGDEIFAFIPGDLLPRLQEFSSASTHVHMVDGPIQIVRTSEKVYFEEEVSYYRKIMVFGERRGGRSYWALDITDPNPLHWTVKWSITGGAEATGATPGFEELGQSWSRPFFTTIRTGPDTVKEVFVFSGGYDIQEDGFPEAFSDFNENGIRDSGEPHSVTIGGTEGYDYFNPGKNDYGRGIFAVDADTGEVLFKATYGDMDVKMGCDQKHTDMKFCFPADISVIPLSDTEILMYAADIYGNIWKITYNYFAEGEGVAYNATSSKRWKVKRIFASNPGSNMATGDPDAFTSGPALNLSDAGRKTFYSPDVSLSGTEWTARPVLYFGTGDREHPRYAMISNRFYVVADTGELIDERNLLNLTCNELDDDSDANGDGMVNAEDWDVKSALVDLLYDGSALGFYRVLDKQGQCIDDPVDHTGEQVMSQPTVFFKNVYFTTYQPTFNDPCNPLGNAFIYALDYSFGRSTFNYNTDNDTEDQVRDITDTYRMITGTSIPSGVKVIIRDGYSAGFVSTGGALVGVGEDGSSNIPGPPSGVTPLLWETE
jgi:Tfp pilus tip-associated adhesin PilY1